MSGPHYTETIYKLQQAVPKSRLESIRDNLVNLDLAATHAACAADNTGLSTGKNVYVYTHDFFGPMFGNPAGGAGTLGITGVLTGIVLVAEAVSARNKRHINSTRFVYDNVTHLHNDTINDFSALFPQLAVHTAAEPELVIIDFNLLDQIEACSIFLRGRYMKKHAVKSWLHQRFYKQGIADSEAEVKKRYEVMMTQLHSKYISHMAGMRANFDAWWRQQLELLTSTQAEKEYLSSMAYADFIQRRNLQSFDSWVREQVAISIDRIQKQNHHILQEVADEVFNYREEVADNRLELEIAGEEDQLRPLSSNSRKYRGRRYEVKYNVDPKIEHKFPMFHEISLEYTPAYKAHKEALKADIEYQAEKKRRAQNGFDRFLEKMSNTRLGKIVRPAWKVLTTVLTPVWNFFTHYSLYFWVIWFAAWAVTAIDIGAQVATPLLIGIGFGIPVIIPALALGLVAIAALQKLLAGTKPPLDQEKDLSEKKQALTRAYFARLVEMNHRRQMATQLRNLGAEDLARSAEQEIVVNESDMPSVRSELKGPGKRLQNKHRRRFHIVAEIISSGMTGFIYDFFAEWPIIGLLVAVGIIASGPAMPITTVVGFGVCIAAAVFVAAKGGFSARTENKKTFNLVERKKQVLCEIDALIEHNAQLRQELEKITINGQKPVLPGRIDTWQYLEKYKLTENTPSERRWTRAKDAGWAMYEFIRHFWTGSLLVRSIIGGGALAFALPLVFGSLAMPHISLPVLCAVGLGVGLAWGTFKLVTYFKQKQREKDLKCVKSAEALRHALLREKVTLEKTKGLYTELKQRKEATVAAAPAIAVRTASVIEYGVFAASSPMPSELTESVRASNVSAVSDVSTGIQQAI